MKGMAAAPCKGSCPATAFGWEGRAACTCTFQHFFLMHLLLLNVVAVMAYTGLSLASGQGKVHCNFGIHFDRFAIQQIRLVLPLLDGVERALHQHGMPADQLQVFDSTVFADLRS